MSILMENSQFLQKYCSLCVVRIQQSRPLVLQLLHFVLNKIERYVALEFEIISFYAVTNQERCGVFSGCCTASESVSVDARLPESLRASVTATPP